MSKVLFKTWEEVTYLDGKKSWQLIGYHKRPMMVPTKITKASYFYEYPSGKRVKVSKTDRIAVIAEDDIVKL